jgi:hypothetical protein
MEWLSKLLKSPQYLRLETLMDFRALRAVSRVVWKNGGESSGRVTIA